MKDFGCQSFQDVCGVVAQMGDPGPFSTEETNVGKFGLVFELVITKPDFITTQNVIQAGVFLQLSQCMCTL